MTQPTLLINNVYAVEVPEGSKKHHLSFTGKTATSDDQSLYYKTKDADELDEWEKIDLPPGSWQLIGTTKEVTEEVAKGIVQVISNGKLSGQPQYRRYDRDPVKDTPAKCWTRDPRHAMETLLASKAIDPNKNYVLLKKLL